MNSLQVMRSYSVPDTAPRNLHTLTLKDEGMLTIFFAHVRKLRQLGVE